MLIFHLQFFGEYWELNPGLLGEKQVGCLCAMQPPGVDYLEYRTFLQVGLLRDCGFICLNVGFKKMFRMADTFIEWMIHKNKLSKPIPFFQKNMKPMAAFISRKSEKPRIQTLNWSHFPKVRLA